MSDYQKNWYQNNKKRLCLIRKSYYKDNKTKIRERQFKKSRTIKSRYLKSINEAFRKKVEFKISLEEYETLINNQCYYCNNELGSKVVAGIGLDRVNNSIGYTVDNVVSCCKICNRIKNENLSSEETVAAINAILFIRKKNKSE